VITNFLFFQEVFFTVKVKTVNLSLCLIIKHFAMTAYGGMEVQLHYSRPRNYMEVSGQIHAPAALLPEEELPVSIG
jgi:hypothetical protein